MINFSYEQFIEDIEGMQNRYEINRMFLRSFPMEDAVSMGLEMFED